MESTCTAYVVHILSPSGFVKMLPFAPYNMTAAFGNLLTNAVIPFLGLRMTYLRKTVRLVDLSVDEIVPL